MIRIAITGHKNIFEHDNDIIQLKLLAKISELIDQHPQVIFIVGQAKGADQIAIKVLEHLDAQYELLDKCSETDERDITKFYTRQADAIVIQCDHIIAIWDGLFSYKNGGTSDIIRRAIESDRPIQIHHLITPQKENPYPLHSLNEEVIDFQNGQFNRIPFAINFSWISFKNSAHRKKKSNKKNPWLNQDASLLGGYFLPFILVIITLILGFIGFIIYQNDNGNKIEHVNNVFNAAQLLTLDSSSLEEPELKTNIPLNLARFLGLIFLIYAFFFGLYLALGDKRALLKLRKWQRKKNFSIVIGLNLESKYLITDLSENHNQNVVLLYQDNNDSFLEELKLNKKVIAIKGNLTSRRRLESLYPNQAKNIYIMSSQDDINLRASQELDVIRDSQNPQNQVDQFIRIEDSFKRKFLHDTLTNDSAARSNIFNFKSNIVRRLLLLFPIDRFHQTTNVDTTQVVILGFKKLGEELLLTILKQGHYTTDKFLEIDIICDNAEDCKRYFYEKYPTAKNINSEDQSIIEQYTWSNITLRFQERENSPQFWLNEENPIYKNITKESILTIYSTAEAAIQSASFINIFLPKLNILKSDLCNLQMYIHYNLPDKKETVIIENYFNELAPRIPIKCFGNFTDECKQNSVHNMALDALPKIIHASYSNVEIHKTDEVNLLWNNSTEKDKDSSRQAADHLWVKLRVMWYDIENEFDPVTFEPSPTLKAKMELKDFQQKFSEFEHRRWCAELLLRGFKPVTEDTNSELYTEISKEWIYSSFKKEKKKYLQLFQHIDLVPFYDLDKEEAKKDLKQLTNITTFLNVLIRTSEKEKTKVTLDAS